MRFLNKVINNISELYLIVSVLYYWSLTALLVNPVVIVLLLVLVFQIKTGKRISGIIIALTLVLINSYLVLALLSELSEFREFNDDARNLLVFGLLYLGLNIISSGVMLYKYINKNKLNQTKIISS